ncbi:hypothetical protein ACJX0J_031381, partial [Zea mays]
FIEELILVGITFFALVIDPTVAESTEVILKDDYNILLLMASFELGTIYTTPTSLMMRIRILTPPQSLQVNAAGLLFISYIGIISLKIEIHFGNI